MMYENANAKINLFLDVLGRRPDGYHDLHTCMQTVSLCDTVSAKIDTDTPGVEIHLSCSLPALAPDASNLAYRAAALYLTAAGIENAHVQMHIEKRIPLSAGLAGGSADAAAVLRLLNRQFGNRLSPKELCSLGQKLGADVPFCLIGGTCQCEGVGEVLTPVKAHPDYTVLIAKTEEGVSTPEAFRLLDARHGDFSTYTPRDPQKIYAALKSGDIQALAGSVYNSFEEVILPLRPDVVKLKEILRDGGAVTAMMSGSGPSVFGIFISDIRAELCAAAIRKMGVFAAVCRTVE